jgi:hypothetical protein
MWPTLREIKVIKRVIKISFDQKFEKVGKILKNTEKH